MLKTAGYRTFFTGKWHLGEADYALPIAQGYDEMKAVGLYHLNAYTYADPKWFPDMPADLREMFARVTKGMLEGVAGQPARETFKINGDGGTIQVLYRSGVQAHVSGVGLVE